jgi:predicted ATPase/DNA-binding XRE family transcriptional regulator
MNDTASFGRWLKLRRIALELTQQDLGRLVGCSTMTIRKIEADERRPSRQLAERLTQHLDIPPAEHAAFLKAARAELCPDRLASPIQDAGPARRRPAHNLPTPSTLLIGRDREVAAVCARMRRADVRLLTLTGPGGVGKTRVALQAGADLLDTFADGIYLVALAPIRDPDLVIPTIAQTLGVKEIGGKPLIARLKGELRDKRLLLLLDNFEQVLDAAPQIAELLMMAPGMKVLSTSRASLHLSGEHEYIVPPLALPPPIDDRRSTGEKGADGVVGGRWSMVGQYAAVQLFVARTQAMLPDFALSPENVLAVTEICRRLDGLPLAIELAAARGKLLAPQALLARLVDRLALLTSGARDLSERQQTLRATIDWSYDLLSDAEQILFRQLAVFVGGCTLEAAEAIASELRIENQELRKAAHDQSLLNSQFSILNLIEALLGKSLLLLEGADGEPRFTMLETIREYALERLETSGEVDMIRRRHARFFLALAEDAAPKLYGAEQGAWLDRLEREHDNLRAALAWSRSEDDGVMGLRLAAALGRFWYVRGYFGEGRRRLEEGLTRSPDAPADVRVHALDWAAEFAVIQSDTAAARAMYEAGAALCRKTGYTSGLASALYGLAWLLLDLGDYPSAQIYAMDSVSILRKTSEVWGLAFATFTYAFVADALGDEATARANAEESLALFRSAGDTWNLAGPLSILGNLALRQGDHAAASERYEQGLALWEEMGDKPGISWGLRNLGAVAQAQSDHARAARLLAESLVVLQELGHKDIAWSLAGLAEAVAGLGQPARAARLFGAAEALREASGAAIFPVDRANYDGAVAVARAQLDDATFDAAWATGWAMTLEQAIAEALRETDEDS